MQLTTVAQPIAIPRVTDTMKTVAKQMTDGNSSPNPFSLRKEGELNPLFAKRGWTEVTKAG